MHAPSPPRHTPAGGGRAERGAPRRHHGGHSPAALPWLGALGERLERATIGTSVLTPTMRYHPSIVAQAFATLAATPGASSSASARARR